MNLEKININAILFLDSLRDKRYFYSFAGLGII